VLLMVTNLEQTRLLEHGAASELPQFLTKPVTPSALFDAIASTSTSTSDHPAHRRGETLPNQRPDITALHGTRILVAEDNPVNQIVAEEMLKRLGSRVLIANNGREAVELALQRNIDAVLMDLQMPEMDGFEATRNIRAQKPSLPIVALTAAALERDRERCLAAGMNDHLGKPVSAPQLLAALQPWVQPRPTPEPAASGTTAARVDAASLDPQAVSELRRLIADNDYVPAEVLAALRSQAGPSSQAALGRVEQALAAFDYDAAARALDELPAATDSTSAN
jgi:two-component system sensor histidine kinase/response regulator